MMNQTEALEMAIGALLALREQAQARGDILGLARIDEAAATLVLGGRLETTPHDLAALIKAAPAH